MLHPIKQKTNKTHKSVLVTKNIHIITKSKHSGCI